MCAVDVGERQAQTRDIPRPFTATGFLITGAVVPPSHLVRADLDRVAQVMSAKLGYPRRWAAAGPPSRAPAAVERSFSGTRYCVRPMQAEAFEIY